MSPITEGSTYLIIEIEESGLEQQKILDDTSQFCVDSENIWVISQSIIYSEGSMWWTLFVPYFHNYNGSI